MRLQICVWCCARKPTTSGRCLLLGQAYAQKGDLTLAKDTYRRLLEVNPKSEEGLQQLAALHAMAREFPEAEELLRKQVELKPDDALASGRLVEVLMAQGQTVKAEAEARRLAALSGQEGVGDFSLGRVLAQKKDFSGAADAFRKSAAARKDDPLPLEGLVRSLLAAGKPDDAIAVLNEQLGNSGENELFAKFLLGGIYGGQGDQARPRRTWRKWSPRSLIRSWPGSRWPVSIARTGMRASRFMSVVSKPIPTAWS